MVINKKRVRILLIFLFTIVTIILVGTGIISAANLNLKITGSINNMSSDVYLKTNPNSNNGIDSYDMFASSLPSGGDYSEFYSSVSGNQLSIDSWKSQDNPRNVSLVYSMSNSQSGALNFSWSGLSSSYNATFYYYGDDSGYNTLVHSVNMKSTSSYAPTLSSKSNVYAKVEVSNYTVPVDYVYPQFSNYYDNNGSLNGSGIAIFNATVDNTNGSVLLSINGTNYSATNSVSNVYDVSVNLSEGTYEYVWYSYGNGSNNNFNSSLPRDYTVNPAPAPFCGDNSCNGNESCSTCPSDCGQCQQNTPGGGGGGGGGAAPAPSKSSNSNFDVSTTIVKSSLKKEESSQKTIIIKNTANTTQTFLIELSPELKNLLFISESSFTLAPGEQKQLSFTIAPTKDTDIGVYSGSINIKSNLQAQKVLVVTDVNDKSSLFDVSIKIPDSYKQLTPGSDLFFNIQLFNFGETERVDATVSYSVKDFDGNVVESKDETVAVETQTSISRTIKLPLDLKAGDYLIVANIKYGNNTATSSDTFKIIQSGSGFNTSGIAFILFILVDIVIIGLIIYWVIRRNRNKKSQ